MEDDKLHNISKKLFENVGFEKPPLDFTEKLMVKIEQANSAETIKPRPFFRNKFMLFFILTFSIISILSFVFQGNDGGSRTSGITEKINLPTIDFSIFSKYLDIDFNFGFIAKLIVGSIIILIVLDLISGSLIDRFIDSKTRKENKV